jgi:hypothetical protein
MWDKLFRKKNTHPPHTCGGHGGHGQCFIPIVFSLVYSDTICSSVVVTIFPHRHDDNNASKNQCKNLELRHFDGFVCLSYKFYRLSVICVRSVRRTYENITVWLLITLLFMG